MVKHIVMWKLKDFAEGKTKEENIEIMKSMLEELIDKIGVIKKLEVGINFTESDAAFDVALYSEFETNEDLETYSKHPEHLKVGEFINKIRDARYVVDYKI
ncbi:Stress responsive A/B Barrel Domain protein [Caloramator mitchellensis]|uniref:Stress responsive A/B Barrel Domain protein n=1 Tax=Caloramator mitchellensis TaxID=908809 RepID=A0A0R3JYE3_CALMK|nr:Dabb family protein [Caloramator mitchellensis]KRQ88090.1 Stress responsive A/B Barrel Domain protein [Caloramator mitchellensis]